MTYFKYLRYITLLVVIITLCGCQKLTKGVVVEKSTRPAYTTVIFTGKTRVPVYHPKGYRLTIKGKLGDESIEETISVDYKTWKNVKVGDEYTRSR